MSWLVNLLMLGKGPAPNLRSFTQLSPNGTPGLPYSFEAKQSAEVTARSTWYYYSLVAGIGG